MATRAEDTARRRDAMRAAILTAMRDGNETIANIARAAGVSIPTARTYARAFVREGLARRTTDDVEAYLAIGGASPRARIRRAVRNTLRAVGVCTVGRIVEATGEREPDVLASIAHLVRAKCAERTADGVRWRAATHPAITVADARAAHGDALRLWACTGQCLAELVAHGTLNEALTVCPTCGERVRRVSRYTWSGLVRMVPWVAP